MSVGIGGIGDIKVIVETAWFLYRDCYKVAKGAPQDFKLLVDELSNLRNSVSLIYEEINDPNSTLRRSGPARVQMVQEMMIRVKHTLMELQKVSSKYKHTLTGKSAKQKIGFWARIKWAIDAPDINKLRNDLVYHNGIMSLLLNAAGNSSLARIENSYQRLEEDVGVIVDHLRRSNTMGATLGSTPTPGGPTGALPSINSAALGDDGLFKLSLAMAFKQNAEEKQPWTTISASEWIRAGTWWLWRAQRDIYADYYSCKKIISKRGFINLVKASWILVDIIAVHPQVVFLPPKARAELEQLSDALKIEFAGIESKGLSFPSLDDIDLSEYENDLCIWQATEKGLALKPNLTKATGTMGDQWAWATTGTQEHVIFQR
ncbi:hypothetical protein DFH27DRAFT_166921 [Peziza echinospora]|nr:hypothetical protein DFH27DRAFT_166921 [Peziza echinospora]